MDNVVVTRFGIFIAVFVIMASLEVIIPARQSILGYRERWPANIGLIILGALISKIVLPVTLVGVALWTKEASYGLFNLWEVSYWISIPVSVLILDFFIYWQHRWFHILPVLWRLHKVHHADSHVDTTTALRFHPVEIALSLLLKASVVLLFGVPAVAVVVFEVSLNAFAIFNHANVRLPLNLDDKLSWFVITQRKHRIHHSQLHNETNSNFGFSLSLWDRVFGTFKGRASKDDETLAVGLSGYPANSQNAKLTRLLTIPIDQRS